MAGEPSPTLEAIRRQHGPWTMHNLPLSDGQYTISPRPSGDEPLARSFSCHIRDVLRRPFAELRVADLGCLEGFYALELAKQGVREAVGIEVRERSVAKAEFARRDLGLQNCRFVQDDARNFREENYGRFDVVLCLGLLYHLDFPEVFHLLEQMRACCDGMVIIDTHVSLFPHSQVTYRGEAYWGWEALEHGEAEDESDKQGKLWASLGNDRSFWLTRASLYNFLDRAGFSSVFEVGTPTIPNRASDRITVVAVAGDKVPFALRELPAAALTRAWEENDAKFFADPSDSRFQMQQDSSAYATHLVRKKRDEMI